MRILVLASDNPAPPINGTRIRNFHLWPQLRALGHEVRVLALTRDKADLARSSEELEFFRFTRAPAPLRVWRRLWHSYHEWPVSRDLHARVAKLVEEWRPDVVHAEELRMGAYLPARRTGGPLVSLCAHNVESDLIRQTRAAPFPFAVGLFNAVYHLNLRRFEARHFGAVDVALTYSQVDLERYRELYPSAPWALSSNGTAPPACVLPLPADPGALLFLGSLSYLPNTEALDWLLAEVLPRTRAGLSLTVAGSTPTPQVRARAATGAYLLLDTPLELAPVYGACSLLVVPLLKGSGTRGKILEALAHGRPVLTTSKGVEGLDIAPGEGIIIADGAEGFFNALERWRDTPLAERQALADRGRAAVEARYTWRAVGVALMRSWEATRSGQLGEEEVG